MFHYKYKWMDGSRSRGKADIAVGDWVQSRYRAPWQGVVLALDPDGGIATVRQERNKRGGPIRKPKTVRYSVGWFKKIEA